MSAHDLYSGRKRVEVKSTADDYVDRIREIYKIDPDGARSIVDELAADDSLSDDDVLRIAEDLTGVLSARRREALRMIGVMIDSYERSAANSRMMGGRSAS